MKKIFIMLIFILTVINAKEITYEDGFKAGYEDGSKESKKRTTILKNISDFKKAEKGVDKAKIMGAFNANFDFLCIMPAKLLYNFNVVNKVYVKGYTQGCEKAIFEKR
ncbi:hypothetical protein [Poseidonibacter ostreae]|uniref:Uncharacterized protein n=1 Tax=Poseidonibacter ostreae TaxID=2654171 RepID=A0A6L4WNA0_9BACT|nr:hypothetical protein [Poseidonibacter ostreae]KAB7881230.1 hypothetical protein GA417_14175 [Poseidonibacter ostreae]KAB7884277.1 hypothetical protein GBG19_16010 [Poseidonibacter ostreae]KAB7886496.1 hypothetical protein GBG18_14580 [Poseidonibacter ostreae]